LADRQEKNAGKNREIPRIWWVNTKKMVGFYTKKHPELMGYGVVDFLYLAKLTDTT